MDSEKTSNGAPEPSSAQEGQSSGAGPAHYATVAGPDAHPGRTSLEGQDQSEKQLLEVEPSNEGIQKEANGDKEPPTGEKQSEVPSGDPMDQSGDSDTLPEGSAITKDADSSVQPTDARTKETEEQQAPDAEASTQQAPDVEASTHPDSGAEGSAAASKEAAGEEHAIDADTVLTSVGNDDSASANPQGEAATTSTDARVSPPPSPRIQAAGRSSGAPHGSDAQTTPTEKALQVATSSRSAK